MSTRDVRDMLGLSAEQTPKPKFARKARASEKRPGMFAHPAGFYAARQY